jgi:hypothetical protein
MKTTLALNLINRKWITGKARCKGTEIADFAQTWVRLLITGELGHTWTALCISFYPLQSPQQSQVCLLAAKGCSKSVLRTTHNKLLEMIVPGKENIAHYACMEVA